MHFWTTLVVLLLSLSGYSSGVVIKSGRSGTRKAVSLDLFVVILMWGGVVDSLSRAVFSRWIWLGIWIAVGLVLGWIMTAIRGYSAAEQMSAVEPRQERRTAEFQRRKAFREFSYKIGTFQSQIILGFLFLFGFGIVGLAVRFLSDPLRIKRSPQGTRWTPRPKVPADLELFKKQF